jgi:hypothetical protein
MPLIKQIWHFELTLAHLNHHIITLLSSWALNCMRGHMDFSWLCSDHLNHLITQLIKNVFHHKQTTLAFWFNCKINLNNSQTVQNLM